MQGISFVIAAGNDADDACYYSPASTPTAYVNKHHLIEVFILVSNFLAALVYTVLIAIMDHYGNCVSICHCSITVAASDAQDWIACYTNYGNCVDIIAPVSLKLLQMIIIS